MAEDVGIPEAVRDIVKGSVQGILDFIEGEVIPLEEKFKDIIHDERRLFGEDGLLAPVIREARDGLRMKSAEAGYYTMFAPESVGGGGLPWIVSPFVLEAQYRKYGPGRTEWMKEQTANLPSQPSQPSLF